MVQMVSSVGSGEGDGPDGSSVGSGEGDSGFFVVVLARFSKDRLAYCLLNNFHKDDCRMLILGDGGAQKFFGLISEIASPVKLNAVISVSITVRNIRVGSLQPPDSKWVID